MAVLSLFALTALLLFAAPATAEVRSGEATDPESSFVSPGQDILEVAANYDTGGSLTATVTTAAAPTEPDTFLGVTFYSVDAAGECAAPLAVLGTVYGSATAGWAYEPSEGTAQKTVAGASTTLSVTDPALANRSLACATAATYEIVEEGGETKLGEKLDYLLSPFRLTAPPPPPPPPPPAVAKLELPTPATLTLKRNRWARLKVKLRNSGDARATSVVVSLGAARGVKLRPKSTKVALKAIAPGATKTATFRVMLTRKAKAVSKLSLKAKGAHGLKASARAVLKVRKPKPKQPPKPKPSGSGSLAGRIFVRLDSTDTMHSAYLRGYAFIDDTWAYNEVPSGGFPHCTKVTGSAKEPGCVKYSYNPRSGAVKVGALGGGKVTAAGLKIDGQSYEEVSIPKPGTKYRVYQYFQGFSGLCGLLPGCTTWRTDLTLTKSGEFALGHSSLSTAGGVGGAPFVAVGSYPPDERGTYRIERGARIRLAFADGHVETKTIAIYRDDKGRPAPVSEGLILDGEYFIFAGDD